MVKKCKLFTYTVLEGGGLVGGYEITKLDRQEEEQGSELVTTSWVAFAKPLRDLSKALLSIHTFFLLIQLIGTDLIVSNDG